MLLPPITAPVQRKAPTSAPAPMMPSAGSDPDAAPLPTIYGLFGRGVQREAAAAEPDAEQVGPTRSAPESEPVQRKADVGATPMAGGAGPDTATIHASAQRGIATAASPLPYSQRIQELFGRYDISGIKAHTGADAAASAGAMGAKAYATGDHVVLGDGADLHTAAHEAAHVVQQRAGVALAGGVGAVGDVHECHADAVADLVVRGESAEHLLSESPGTRGGGPGPAMGRWAVQHKISFDGGKTVEPSIPEDVQQRARKAGDAVFALVELWHTEPGMNKAYANWDEVVTNAISMTQVEENERAPGRHELTGEPRESTRRRGSTRRPGLGLPMYLGSDAVPAGAPFSDHAAPSWPPLSSPQSQSRGGYSGGAQFGGDQYGYSAPRPYPGSQQPMTPQPPQGPRYPPPPLHMGGLPGGYSGGAQSGGDPYGYSPPPPYPGSQQHMTPQPLRMGGLPGGYSGGTQSGGDPYGYTAPLPYPGSQQHMTPQPPQPFHLGGYPQGRYQQHAPVKRQRTLAVDTPAGGSAQAGEKQDGHLSGRDPGAIEDKQQPERQVLSRFLISLDEKKSESQLTGSYVYVLRGKNGKILKVGSTGTPATRFNEYRTRKQWKPMGPFTVDMLQVTDGYHTIMEPIIRAELVAAGETLPIDDTGGRLEKAGQQTVSVDVESDQYARWQKAAGDKTVSDWLKELADEASKEE